jgi:hypothetical protein
MCLTPGVTRCFLERARNVCLVGHIILISASVVWTHPWAVSDQGPCLCSIGTAFVDTEICTACDLHLPQIIIFLLIIFSHFKHKNHSQVGLSREASGQLPASVHRR